MKVVARLCSAAMGFVSVFVFAALFRIGPSQTGPPPLSVRPMSSLRADEGSVAGALTEVRSRTLEARTLLRRSGIVEAQLLRALNATREDARHHHEVSPPDVQSDRL